jgi:LytR cell envelope-related transcriptional attenuator
VRDNLAGRGFNPGDIGDTAVQGDSVISYAPGEENLAQYAADQLGGTFALFEDTAQRPGRLSIIVGTDYQPAAGLKGSGVVRLQPTSPTSPDGDTDSGTDAPATSNTMPTAEIDADGVTCVN